MKLKRTLCLILAAVCMLGCFATTASAITNSGIQVTVNGIAVPFSDDAGYPYVNSDSRTLVPLRAAGQAMGLDVQWDGAAKAVTFYKEYETDPSGLEMYALLKSRKVVMSVGSKDYEITEVYLYNDADGKGEYSETYTDTYTMDTVMVNQSGRTYAPIRYVAEAFEYEVSWDAASKTVGITEYLPWEANYSYACNVEGDTIDTVYLAFAQGTNVQSIQVTEFWLDGYYTNANTLDYQVVDKTYATVTAMTHDELAEIGKVTDAPEPLVTGVKVADTLKTGSDYYFFVVLEVAKTNGAVDTSFVSFNLNP